MGLLFTRTRLYWESDPAAKAPVAVAPLRHAAGVAQRRGVTAKCAAELSPADSSRACWGHFESQIRKPLEILPVAS